MEGGCIERLSEEGGAVVVFGFQFRLHVRSCRILDVVVGFFGVGGVFGRFEGFGVRVHDLV